MDGTRSGGDVIGKEAPSPIDDLIAQGKIEDALALARRRADRKPDRPAVQLKFCETAILAERAGLAQKALANAIKAGANKKQQLRYAARIAALKSDHAAQISALQALLDMGAKLSAVELRGLCSSYYFTGDLNRAEPLAEEFLARKPGLNAAKLRLRIFLAKTRVDSLEDELRDFVFGGDGRPEMAQVLPTLPKLMPAGSTVITELMEKAARKWPEHAAVKSMHERQTIVQAKLDQRPDYPDGATREEQCAFVCEVLKKQYRSKPENLAALLEALQATLTPEALHRDLIHDDPNEPVIVSPKAPGGKVMIVIPGIGAMTGMPLIIIDAFCAMSGYSAIYVRDLTKLLLFDGIAGVDGGYEGATAHLRQIIDKDLQGDNLTITGFSGGGTGALLYGASLKADRVLLLSCAVNLSTKFLDRIGDDRARVIVNRAAQHPEAAKLVNATQVLKRSGHRPQLDFIRGEGAVIDSKHARFVRQILGANEYIIPGTDAHNSPLELLLRGGLVTALKGDFESADPSVLAAYETSGG